MFQFFLLILLSLISKKLYSKVSKCTCLVRINFKGFLKFRAFSGTVVTEGMG